MGADLIQLKTSRAFLIQQSVLNAIKRKYPHGYKRFGAGGVLKLLQRGNLFISDGFYESVRFEYRRLRIVYDEVPAPSGPIPSAAFDLPDGFWCGARA